MDLSHLSTADLQALHAGDLSKMSTEGLQSLQQPVAAAAPTAAPSPVPAAVQPPAAAPDGGTGVMNGVAKIAENAAQGGTMGFADEIGAGIAKPVAYALKNILPQGMGGEDVTYDQVSKAVDKLRKSDQSDLQAWNSENPELAIPSQIAGGMATMGPIGELFSAAAPVVGNAVSKIPAVGEAIANYGGKAANALSKFAEANPYKAAAGTGAVQGSIYGAGVSDEGHRGQGALAGGVGGALLGPSIKYLGDNLVGPALSKGKSALQNFLKSSEDDVVTGAEKMPPPDDPPPPPAATEPQQYSDLTNKPLGEKPVTAVTGTLPLSRGVRSKDTNLLRIEDQAKQGNLGPEAQAEMQKTNDAVHQSAMEAMQHLKGVTNKSSHELLENSVEQFQAAAKAAKAHSDTLYERRDALMADAVLDKKKVGPSLGSNLSDVVTNPRYVAGFKSKSGAAASQLYDDYKNLITGTEGRELPFTDLAAWRADVSHLANTDLSTAGTLAKALGRSYDKWMDNISQDVMLSGNPEAAAAAKAASANYAKMKGLYGSKNSSIIEGMTKPYDMTPADFTTGLFGKKGVEGTAKTALNVNKILKVLPEEHQQEVKNNIFSGLISRILEGGNGDMQKLSGIRNGLSSLQKSQVYREQFKSDTAKDEIITNLIKDLTQQLEQPFRKDVTGPSGGMIMRGLNGLLNIPASIPLVNKIPMVKIPAALGKEAAALEQKFTDRKVFNAAIKEAAQTAHKAARSGPIFDLDALKAGISGGTAAGSVVQINSREKKK